MQDELRLPRDGETGQKLIRRSMAKLARSRLGELSWIEGQLMLGHSVHDPVNALAVTEQIIDEIEALAPGAFHRGLTGVRLVSDWKEAI